MTIQETQTPKTETGPEPKLNRKRWWLIGGAIVLIAVIIFSSFQIAGGIAANNAKQAEEEAAQAAKTAEEERVKWFVKRVYDTYKDFEIYPEDDETDFQKLCDAGQGLVFKATGTCSITAVESPEENKFTFRTSLPSVSSASRETDEYILDSWQALLDTSCRAVRGGATVDRENMSKGAKTMALLTKYG